MAELDSSARKKDRGVTKEFLLRKVREQSSGIVRGFWLGKLAQLSPFSPREDAIDSHVRTISCHESCLSPSVRALLSRPLVPLSGREGGTFVKADLTLNWEEVGAHFAEVDPGLADCTMGATAVADIAASALTPLLALTSAESRKSFEERVCWTGHTREFMESLRLLTAEPQDPPAVLLSLLLSTAYLERAVGDVYLHALGSEPSSKGDRCPGLLKDLLGKEELVEVFGALPVYCVRCLMGPPTSLNLRNLVWHGFLAPTELHPEYAALMVVLVGSLGELLEGRWGEGIFHRPPTDLQDSTSLLQEVTAGFSPDPVSLKHLLLSSFLILPSRRAVWSAALDLWTQGRYGFFLLLILPELETSLRIVFACCNDCPHRVLTAEDSVLFTTFVEILNPVVSGGDTAEVGARENQLVEELGRPITEMLLDLLVHTQGLRLRDRISHGEVNLWVGCRELATFVLFVTVALCQKYVCPATGGEVVPNDVVCKYRSMFHPTAFLKREVLCVLDMLAQWDAIRVPQEGRDQGNVQEAVPEGRGQERAVQVVSATSGLEPCVVRMMDWAQDGRAFPCRDTVPRVWRNLWTLFLPRHQLELIGLLQQVTANCHRALAQVQATAEERYVQFCGKALRSRQRENYQRLLHSLPTFRTTGYFCIAAVLSRAAQLAQPEEAARRAVRDLKQVLSLVEKLQSHTSATRNQWAEASQLCHSMLPQLTDRLSHTHTRMDTHAERVATITEQNMDT